MPRWLKIVAAALAVVVVFIAAGLIGYGLANNTSHPPDEVQSAAQAYVQVQNTRSERSPAVESIVRATGPSNLTQTMSKATFSDSVYYTASYGLQASATAGRLQAPPYPSGRGVPYPPLDAWCVRLNSGNIFVVAFHKDMYGAGWVLHELVDPSSAARQIGCKSILGPTNNSGG